MRILGIDPGTIILGCGIIESDDEGISMVMYKAIRCRSGSSMGDRLLYLYTSLCDIIKEYLPDEIAIETPFVAKNARTALAIGKAQAIALLAAASNSIPAFEYTPTAIKHNAASYGASSKEQVQEMVRLQLNLKTAPSPADCSDALAAAICHLHQSRLNNLTGGK